MVRRVSGNRRRAAEAYCVLLLHKERDGRVAWLSAALSREEHLVLFSFGGFVLSAGLWFLARLLPLELGEAKTSGDGMSQCPTKEEPKPEMEVETQELEQIPEATETEEATVEVVAIPSEPEAAPSEDLEKPMPTPAAGAMPFPFPRGPSRPRRGEAWGSPKRSVTNSSLTSVPEADEACEDAGPGREREEPQAPLRLNVTSFLAGLPPAAVQVQEELPLEPEPASATQTLEEVAPSGAELAAPAAAAPAAPHPRRSAGRWQRCLCSRGRGKAALRRALLSLAAHLTAGLALLLAGYILVVALALLSAKLLFGLARMEPRPLEPLTVEAQRPPSVTTSPSNSPLAKVSESYAASWGFFPSPERSEDAQKLGMMPAVPEEDAEPKSEGVDLWQLGVPEPKAQPAGEADAQGVDALRCLARPDGRPAGRRSGRPEGEVPGEPLPAEPPETGKGLERPAGASTGPEGLARSQSRTRESEHFPHCPSPGASPSINALLSEESSTTGGSLGAFGNARRNRRRGFQPLALLGPPVIFVIVLCHAALLFFIFVFDLVFIEKYTTSSLSRRVILAAENATCANSHRLPPRAFFRRPGDCARALARSTAFEAFSLGPADATGLRGCYPQDGPRDQDLSDLSSFCPWMRNPGFDFFVLDTRRPCGILGRGTSLSPDAVAFAHGISDDLAAVFAPCSFCGGLQAMVDLARFLLHADVALEQFLLKLRSLHRLLSASAALGAVSAALLLALFDVYTLLALGREGLLLRRSGLLRFAACATAGQALEQVVILLLHCVLMAGLSFQLELANDLWPQLHCAKRTEPLEGHAWHVPLRWTGSVLVCFAAAISILFAVVLMGGFAYRLPSAWLPARWAVPLIYNLKLARFAGSRQTLAVLETPGRLMLCPWLGLLASLGFWHRSTCRAFQVVRRQEWYLPAIFSADGSVFPADCVGWNAVASATVQSLSVAWLLLPYGALIARACLYLNERIIFAFGDDGGGSADEPDQLLRHVKEDTGLALHALRWAAAVGHLVTILLLASVDFLDLPHQPREALIRNLVLTGAVLSLLRAVLATASNLRSFLQRRALVTACSQLVQDSLCLRVVQSNTWNQLKTHPRSRSEEQADALGIRPPGHFGKKYRQGCPRVSARTLPIGREDDCLPGLSDAERERVVMACRDLLQLEWVKKGQLPAALAAKLRAARTARSFRAEALRRGRGLDNAALLLLLREVAEEDICEQLCSAEAKSVVCEHLRQHCTLQAGKLQLWLQAQAKSQTARWAAALVNSGAIGDLLEDMGEAFVRKKSSEEQERATDSEDAEVRKSDSFPSDIELSEASRARLAERRWRAEEAPQSLRMLFAVSQHGLVRISGHWAVGGREIVPERQASVHISAQMEVVLHWPRDDVFSSSNVQVEFISHQIWPPLPPKPAEGGLAVKRSDSRQHLSTRRHLASRSWGWPGRSASPAEEEERELWHIQCRVAWASETDTEDASVLETELGDLTWSSPVALPALERRRPDRDGPLRASTASAVGARVASLISSGPVGLLGHVGRVALQDPSTLPADLVHAAAAAASAAAAAAQQAPKSALRALEVALRSNAQHLGSAFLGALYAKDGGLSQAEMARRSWLMAAAARRLQKTAQARRSEPELETELLWTGRERKRWLRSSERHRMGLTFLGPLPKEQKEEEVAGSRRNSDADRSTPRSGRSHSEGSDRVTPFHGSRATTPPVIVTDVDYTDVDLEASLSLAPISGRNLAAEAQEAHGGSEKKLLKKQFFEMAATKPSEIPQLRKMLEEARQGAVDALDLAKMEQCLENCVALERAALGLLEAIQSGSIRQLESRLSIARELGLHSSAFPDETGAGVVQLATAKLEEEKAAAPLRLEAALHAFAKHAQQGVLGIGVIALQRCIDQARAAKIQDNVKLYKVEAKLHLLCERKREIALLKAAMAVEDAWLLKAATEECRQRFGELTFGVDLTLAKCQLEVWERTEDVSERRSRLETLVSIEEPDARAVHVEERARMALRAAMFHEPPQAELLRLAIARARRAKGTVPIAELQQAERALQEEREVEQALEQLRKAAAARDARALRRAIADCTDVGVEQRRLIPATVQLCDSLSELVQLGQRHGLSARDLTAERFQLRQDLAELQSGLRTVCRVRPPLPQELQDARLHAETAAPVLRRVDRHTLEVALSGGYATSDFSAVLGPESTQAEVFGELSGLAQSAMDGHNVALIACGPSGAGKSFTLCGTSEQPGLLPRILEELFALKAQLWRSDIAVDVQALEVVDDEPPRDLLRPPGSEEQPVHVRRQGRQGPGPSQALRCGPVRLAAATRRAALRELKDLVQDRGRLTSGPRCAERYPAGGD
ncbi:unnamed protein product [Effrenium voratum]|nr:unnamed protein product [Effrenium voratum]